ncbi:flagellar basal body-associated FliL family protein [Pontivivens nitratireducens]|uniref:Flagellar protein FliL n=1 Tax=Pontivivens nitratireducens TaxID=2758038 RepID=A0A6G7VL87_9RHOB|nr:flagellar basal body-associated FliL family protein [Pontibrevibacter nitratireducens]QIK40625.1 flagellar basal body-associated FliL family protein [Pontibrevibacter nitratireducens]
MRLLFILLLVLASAGGGAGSAWFLRPGSEVMEVGNAAEDPQDLEHYSYVELQNQFVVPLTEGDTVTGLVAVSLAIEGKKGEEQTILHAEPRLRDAFLRVLFEHARADGFQGDFTNDTSMAELRSRLSAAALDNLGQIVSGVLITSVTRQDF